MALYNVTVGGTPQASDLNQLVDVFNGNHDVGTITLSPVVAAPATTGFALTAQSGSTLGVGTYNYQFTYVTGYYKSDGTLVVTGETTVSPALSITTASANTTVKITIPVPATGAVCATRIYRTAVGGSTYGLIATIKDGTTIYTDSIADGSRGAVPPASNTTGTNLNVNNGFVSGLTYLHGQYGRIATSRSDNWLGLNDTSAHSAGVYFGSSVVRTDGQLQVGLSGGKFLVDANGNMTVAGTSTLTGTLTANGGITVPSGKNVTSPTFVSNVAVGTAPFTVASTTTVTNLSADMLDGMQPATANTVSTIVQRDASGNFSAGTITAALSGNASTATKLATARTLSWTGDATGSLTFDGSANASAALTLANSGATAGTYRSVTVNAKGLVTGGTNPTTVSGYGITDAYTKTDINTARNETFDNFVYSSTDSSTGTSLKVTAMATALQISVAAGTAYVGGVRYTPATTTITLTASTTQYIYVNSSGVITASTTAPTGDYADLATVTVPASGTIPAANIIDTRDIIFSTNGKYTYDLYNDSGTYMQTLQSRGPGGGLLLKNTGSANAITVHDNDSNADMFLVDGMGNIKLQSGADFYIYSDAGTTQKFYVDGATGNTTVAGTIGVTGATTLTGLLTANGGITVPSGKNVTSPTFVSNIATGTAPFTVTSTTAVANLNADMVDGYHMNQDVRTTASPTFAGLTIGNNVIGTNQYFKFAPKSGGQIGFVNSAANAWGLQVLDGTKPVTKTFRNTLDDGSGNMGIGIDNPSYGLQVLGGSARIQALATPSAPTVTPQGTAGSTTYTYYVYAVDSIGNRTLASPGGSTTTGNATLSSTNYNKITWTAVPGALSYDICKGQPAGSSLATGVTATTINDTGQATTAYTAPSRNTTGDLVVDGYSFGQKPFVYIKAGLWGGIGSSATLTQMPSVFSGGPVVYSMARGFHNNGYDIVCDTAGFYRIGCRAYLSGLNNTIEADIFIRVVHASDNSTVDDSAGVYGYSGLGYNYDGPFGILVENEVAYYLNVGDIVRYYIRAGEAPRNVNQYYMFIDKLSD